MRSGGSRLLLLLFWGDFALCSPELLLTDFFEGNCAILPDHHERCGEPVDRFFYHAKSRKCERFVDFGCPMKLNRYNTLEECQRYCAPKDICHLPADRGSCNFNQQRWFYDPNTQSCKIFTFGGCRGNANNFLRPWMCELTCQWRGFPGFP